MINQTIAAPLAAALTAKGYESLTAVQSAMLEDEAQGRDLLVSAQTGSGKTVAFGIAMAAELLRGADKLLYADTPMALIIAPTRELALQVARELEWLYAQTEAKIATALPPSRQLRPAQGQRDDGEAGEEHGGIVKRKINRGG